jgi:hypothetical protein
VVVPYFDVPTMAARIVELIEHDDRRREAGRHGRAKVQSNHDVDVVAPRLLKIISDVAADVRGI